MNIAFVLNTLTKGTHATTSKGESPAQVSECTGKIEFSSPGNWILKLTFFCETTSFPTIISKYF